MMSVMFLGFFAVGVSVAHAVDEEDSGAFDVELEKMLSLELVPWA